MWKTCDNRLVDFSPTGAAALGVGSVGDGNGEGQITLLDAADGSVSRRPAWPTSSTRCSPTQWAWEDDSHVAGRRCARALDWSVVRLGTDGSMELRRRAARRRDRRRDFDRGRSACQAISWHSRRRRVTPAPASPAGTSRRAGRAADGARPRATSSAPRAATIAPLSVHRPGRGTRTRTPTRAAPLLGHRPESAVGGDAAADQQVVDAGRGRRVERLADQHVADGLLEGRRHVGDRHRLAGPLAGLDPAGDGRLETREREVEAVPLQVAACGQPAREVDVRRVARRARPGRCAGRPGTAVRAAGPPCRRPPRPRRRWSRRSARRRRSRRSTRSSEECPPETSIARHGSGSGPCSSWSTATWAARWLTPYNGLPSPIARALAAATPTRSAPAETGTAGDGDRVDVVEADARRSRPRARASAPSPPGGRGGHLGHHAAEAGVLVDAAGHRVGQQRVARGRCPRRSRRTRSRCRAPGVRRSRAHPRSPVPMGRAATTYERQRCEQSGGWVASHRCIHPSVRRRKARHSCSHSSQTPSGGRARAAHRTLVAGVTVTATAAPAPSTRPRIAPEDVVHDEGRRLLAAASAKGKAIPNLDIVKDDGAHLLQRHQRHRRQDDLAVHQRDQGDPGRAGGLPRQRRTRPSRPPARSPRSSSTPTTPCCGPTTWRTARWGSTTTPRCRTPRCRSSASRRRPAWSPSSTPRPPRASRSSASPVAATSQRAATLANLTKVGYTAFAAERFFTKWTGTAKPTTSPARRHGCTTVEYKAGTRKHIETDLTARRRQEVRHRAQRR